MVGERERAREYYYVNPFRYKRFQNVFREHISLSLSLSSRLEF